MKPSVHALLVWLLALVPAGADDDLLAPWRQGIVVRPVGADTDRHSIHAYFNTCPESPDGQWVLYFSSGSRDGHHGEHPRSNAASERLGLICYDLAARTFLIQRDQWGHPGGTRTRAASSRSAGS